MPDRPRLCLMAVHAHPDDEVFGTGGTFVRYAEEGLSTVLVCATKGEEGEIHDPNLDPVEAKPRLGEIRMGELDCSARTLRIGAVEILGYRDSGMAGTPENENPECFHQADLNEATARLVRLIRRYRPSVLITYNAFGSYGHPDHIKAHQVTHAAFGLAADPSFAPTPNLAPWQPLKLYESVVSRERMRRWREIERKLNPNPAREEDDRFDPEKLGTPDAEITTRLDVRAYDEVRRQAMLCHRTQFPPDSFFLKPLPEEIVAEGLWGVEEFVRVRSLVAAPEKEDDLFAGIR